MKASIAGSRPEVAPCRILIVDDDPIFQDTHAVHMRQMGYEVYVAEGEGDVLLRNAEDLAHRYRCHIALVDMKLKDHNDPKDHSGLDLADLLKPTASIIVSGFGDVGVAVAAVKQGRIFDFIEKSKGAMALTEAIKQAVEKLRPTQPQLDFHPDYANAVIRRLKLPDPTMPYDEPICVLRRLYREAESALPKSAQGPISRVVCIPATEHYRTSEEVAPLERSVVLLAQSVIEDTRWAQPKIIKLASRKQIQDEVDRYHQFVKPFLSPLRTARIEDSQDSICLWDVGGILYTNIATHDRTPLRAWYSRAESRDVSRAIKDLFNETLGPWYREPSAKDYGLVYDYYLAHFSKLRQRLTASAKTNKYIEIPGIPHRLLDPIVWAKANAPHSYFLSRWTAYTHGDLHSDNIFVDQYAQTSVIDYERSGPGYILRDFVELETDLRLRLLPLHSIAELKLVYELDLIILTPEHSNKLPRWRDIPGLDPKTQSRCRKVFEAITTIRQLVRQYAGLEQMKEYYWALLMETLFSVLRDYAEWDNQQEAELAHKRALLSAALIAERLDHWNEKWAPDEWGRRLKDDFSRGYALLIGVGNTKYQPDWSLPVSVKDVLQIQGVLSDEKQCAYPRHQIRLLHDTSATAERIRSELQWLCEQATFDHDATIVVYFSGHGWRSATGQYALIPHDANPEKMSDTVLWGETFSELLQAIPARRLLVILDACHAGGLSKSPSDSSSLPAGFSKGLPPQSLFNTLQQGTGRIILCSCGENQHSYILNDGSLSIFTHHLIEALQGKANHPGETEVKISNLIGHLGKSVPITARNQNKPDQIPWSNFTGEDFPIALLAGGKGISS